jgi:predicted PurR-regulated permease PerM
VLLGLAAFVIVVAGMRAAEPLMAPFLLAAFVAVAAAPPLFWLQGRGVPKAAALLVVLGTIVLAGALVLAVIGTSVTGFSNSLPAYQARLSEQTAGLYAWLAAHGLPVPDAALRGLFDPGVALRVASSMLRGLGGVLGDAFLILLTVVFILLEAAGFPAKLRAAFGDPDSHLPRFTLAIAKIKEYMALKTLVSLGTGLALGLWLAVLGVDYAVLWGLLAFLLNYVPTIGSVAAAVPAVLLALVQLGGGTALLAAGGYVAVNVVVGNVIEPRLMGRGMNLSPLVVFVSMVFWGWVLGTVGMLLSVPLTMVIKVALDANDATRWLGVLLSGDVGGDDGDADGDKGGHDGGTAGNQARAARRSA